MSLVPKYFLVRRYIKFCVRLRKFKMEEKAIVLPVLVRTLIIILPIGKKKKNSFGTSKSICMKIGQTLEYKTVSFHISQKRLSFIYLK